MNLMKHVQTLKNWLIIVLLDMLLKTFLKWLYYFYLPCHRNIQVSLSVAIFLL